MSIFDSQGVEIPDEAHPVEEKQGSLKKSDDLQERLMHSIIEGDKEEVEDGRMIVESINQGITSFNRDMMFKNLVNNYKMAENLYGETMIRQLSGYDPSFVKKNVNIPEFRDELRKNLEDNIDRLKDKKMLDKDGQVTQEAVEISSLIMYMEELDKLRLKGWGKKEERKKDVYGEKHVVKDYHGERYRDVALKQSVKQAIRRNHDRLLPEDLKVHERRKQGKIEVIYALDASGSMKGDKIGMAKKSGIALAYKAVREKNKVGLIIFGSDIKRVVEPCEDFPRLLHELASTQAGMETNISKTIRKAVDMFSDRRVTKHLMLLTDALPTRGREPIQETLEAASFARSKDVTISLLGINLDRDGSKLARKVVEIGEGRLYKVKNLEDMDGMVLEDYYSFS